MIKSGVIFNERYEIQNRIGTGGMAEVYKGLDHKLNRLVALKVLKKEFREDASFVEKFHTEARSAAGLMHPNIVNVYDVGEYRGLHYIVMELVEGITLKEYIVKKGKLSWKEVISVSIQVCAGIEAAHQRGLIHRDIKPQNIMISHEGKVKVTDFGIARATSSNTVSTNMMGSVHYSSPEQVRGGFSDGKSDVYSLGITMYEMATGRVPFDGDSTVAVAVKHIREEIQLPSGFQGIPHGLQQIILKATQKSPDMRYVNMNEMMLDLKRALVDPDGDFVRLHRPGFSSDTVLVTPKELNQIQKKANGEKGSYPDGDEFGETDELSEERTRQNVRERKRKEEKDKEAKRISNILKIVVVVIFGFLLVFATVKGAKAIRNLSPGSSATKKNEKIKVPNLVGKTLEEAKEIAKEKGLQVKVVSEKKSEEYDEGLISSQKTAPGTKVHKNATIQVVVSSGLTGKEIEIPDVSGMSEDDAKKALKEKGFKNIDIDFDYSDSVEEGKVISTTPATGSKGTADTAIVISVSKGAKKIRVPNLVGMSESEAQDALSKLGLSGKASYEYSNDVANGYVASQGTKADKEVSKGEQISFVVSQGPEKKSVTVPYLIGKTKDSAASLLSGAGLSMGSVTEEYNNSVTAGYVISQSISSGQKVEEGTTVNIVISRGSEPIEEPIPSPDNSNSDVPSPGRPQGDKPGTGN